MIKEIYKGLEQSPLFDATGLPGILIVVIGLILFVYGLLLIFRTTSQQKILIFVLFSLIPFLIGSTHTFASVYITLNQFDQGMRQGGLFHPDVFPSVLRDNVLSGLLGALTSSLLFCTGILAVFLNSRRLKIQQRASQNCSERNSSE
jgi:hypothetical protein